MLGVILASALPVALAAKAKPPETLARSGKWYVDYDEDACNLVAEFGAGQSKVIMRMTRYSPGESFHFTLYGSRFATGEVTGKAKTDFGLAGEPLEASSVSGNVGKLKALFFNSMRLDGWRPASPQETGPKITPEQEASVSGVTIQIARRKPFRLEFGSLCKPLAQMRSCQDNLVKSWGYDPAIEASLSRPLKPLKDARDWLKDSDYPREALTGGYSGIVQVRLEADASGKITGCHVLNRTKPDLFADLTCRNVAKRAILEPALDAAGKPVRSFSVFSVNWIIAQ